MRAPRLRLGLGEPALRLAECAKPSSPGKTQHQQDQQDRGDLPEKRRVAFDQRRDPAVLELRPG